MSIRKQPLFDDSEKAEIGRDLETLERMAAEEIAKYPEKREQILGRLQRVSRMVERATPNRTDCFLMLILG